MDNITHALAGAAMAESLVPKAAKLPRGTLILASALANNAPDFEALWTSSIMPGKLGYLLFHRGHSHTLLGWPFLSLALIALFFFYFKLRKQDPGRRGYAYLTALCFLGPPMHIFLDFVGNYGLHPFWPWDNNWYYGDALFIIDPIFWFALSGSLLYRTRNTIMKGVYGTHLILTVLLLCIVPFVGWLQALFVIAFGVALLLCIHFMRETWRIPSLSGFMIFYVVGAFATSSWARSETVHSIEALNLFPKEEIADIILSPYPANPFCWRTLVIRASEDKDLYEIWSGYLSVVGVSDDEKNMCSLKGNFEPNVEIEFLSPRSSSKNRWLHVWRNEISTMRELATKSCHFEAFLYYSRAPAWNLADRETLYISDLRYDRNEELGFAELKVPITRKQEECPPPRLPVWTGPRMNLLSAQ